jgi:sec-independent protein translocase protein TatA
MFSIGFISLPDLFVILIVVLLIFGAGRLPEIARSLGKAINEFKKAMKEDDSQSSKKE